MGKNILKKIGIAFLLLSFLFLLYRLISYDKETYFKRVSLSENNQITNRTDVVYLDTIVSVALEKIAIENIKVLILPLKKNKIIDNNFEIRAHVRAFGNFYYIWIDDMSKDEYINVLSHEIIHIHQYYTGRIVYEDNKVFFNKKEYDLEKISYENRPWESEAFILQNALKETLIKELY